MQCLPMKVPLAAPGSTRNAPCVEDEREVFLSAWKQACHSVPANSLQGPGRRLQVLQCLVAGIFINGLYRIVTCDEFLWPTLLPATGVFF
jgi:hypothetical protein